MNLDRPAANAETPSLQVPIHLGERSYQIQIGRGLFDQASSYAQVPTSATALIVSNTTVAPLYAAALSRALQTRHKQVLMVELPDGEAYKDWHSLNLIFDALLAAGADRKTVLYALGGGVVGDMTGYAAASFMRGVPFVQVPTTLLAQVDSSVGGKTAINHPLGKNMIGAFYQPVAVICDSQVLKTLPDRELSAGLAEVIKYGPIADAAFFAWLQAHMDALLARDEAALHTAIARSCEIKAQIVGLDEKETTGLRAILNFGHTFGHAIEAGLGYGAWLHGEAVGCGMVLAARLSNRLGLIDKALVQQIEELVHRAGLPTRCPPMGEERYLSLMRLDKKNEDGQIRFVLLDALGQASMHAAPDALVAEVIASCVDHRVA